MALDLKKLGRSRDADDESSGYASRGRKSSPSPAPPPEFRPARPDPRHGRTSAPPPPGSGYGDYLDWASEGGLSAPSDVALAVKLWLGSGDRSEEESSAPGMR